MSDDQKLPDHIEGLAKTLALDSDLTIEEARWKAMAVLSSARIQRDYGDAHTRKITELELELACLRYIDDGGEWYVSGVDDDPAAP